MIFGQPQLLVVELPYGDCEEEFAQQGYNYSLAPGSPPQEHNYYNTWSSKVTTYNYFSILIDDESMYAHKRKSLVMKLHVYIKSICVVTKIILV